MKDVIGWSDDKDRRKKAINRDYDQLTTKYQDSEPLPVRMSCNSKYIESVETVGED